MNLVKLLENSVRQHAPKPALIEDSAAVSYAELGQRVSGLAAKLEGLAFAPGSRIGLHYPNSVVYVALTFALWKAGAVVVPIPVECTEEEVENLASSMELQGILSAKPAKESSELMTGCYFTRRELERPADNHGLNIAFIRFTSGTTSARKGVVLCHETIRDRIAAANQGMEISSGDTVMWCLPMSHHFLVTIVLYLSQGATIVLCRHVIARSFLESINR